MTISAEVRTLRATVIVVGSLLIGAQGVSAIADWQELSHSSEAPVTRDIEAEAWALWDLYDPAQLVAAEFEYRVEFSGSSPVEVYPREGQQVLTDGTTWYIFTVEYIATESDA